MTSGDVACTRDVKVGVGPKTELRSSHGEAHVGEWLPQSGEREWDSNPLLALVTEPLLHLPQHPSKDSEAAHHWDDIVVEPFQNAVDTCCIQGVLCRAMYARIQQSPNHICKCPI